MLPAASVACNLTQAYDEATYRVRTDPMNASDQRRRTGRRHLLVAAVVVLVAITQYAGLKDAAHDFERGVRDGTGGR